MYLYSAISINRYFDKFATYFKASLTLPSKPNRRKANETCNPNNMSNITHLIPAPSSVSRTTESPSLCRTPDMLCL